MSKDAQIPQERIVPLLMDEGYTRREAQAAYHLHCELVNNRLEDGTVIMSLPTLITHNYDTLQHSSVIDKFRDCLQGLLTTDDDADTQNWRPLHEIKIAPELIRTAPDTLLGASAVVQLTGSAKDYFEQTEARVESAILLAEAQASGLLAQRHQRAGGRDTGTNLPTR